MKKLKVFAMVLLIVIGLIVIRPAISYAQENTMMGNMNDSIKAPVAISGYCPMCLLSSNMKERGSDNFTTEYRGKVYKFVNIGMQRAFLDNPEKYSKDAEAKFIAMPK